MDSPYRQKNVAEDAFHHVNNIYEKILPNLTKALNSLHKESHSVRYWRILIGPWLNLYLSALYDRFIHIKYAINNHPNFTTLLLSEKAFVTPSDTLDFACLLSEDSYNLQLYTKILIAFEKEFPRKYISISRNALYKKLLVNTWQRKSISFMLKMYAKISTTYGKTISLRNSYFSKKIELNFALSHIFHLLPNWSQYKPCPSFPQNIKERCFLKDIDLGDDEFEKFISKTLYLDIPKCFIEGYSFISKEVENNYHRYSDIIFSSNGWYYDESFKQWAAKSAENGALLLGNQHGGNYGALKTMPSENHETTIVDFYYSWGWSRTDCMAKVIPMPATKLTGRKKIGASNKKTGILWVTTSAQRYVTQLPFLPSHFEEYLTWQKRFVNALPETSIQELRFRPHYENYAWGTVERILDCIPNIQVESWAIPFETSLENCRLYVCDHLSTTFAEALAANKPTVLFWNPDTNILRPAAQPYFDSLRDCGILFDTPEAAALVVNAVYSDVEAWWNVAERQKTIRSFCERFARTSPDAFTLWSEEFERVTTLQPRQS